MYIPVTPSQLDNFAEPREFFVRLKSGDTGASTNTFGPCRFVKWEPETNLVRYIDSDGNAAHAETDQCDFFISGPAVDVAAAPADHATQPVLAFPPDAPFIEWKMNPGEGFQIAHGKVVYPFAILEAFSL